MHKFKYLNKFDIFYKHQYVFRPKHNTNKPIILLLNKIYEGLNKSRSEYSLGIYLDMIKAFDTTDTEILLNKLTNRTQFVICK